MLFMTFLVFDRLIGVFIVINGLFKYKSYKLVIFQLRIYFCDKFKFFVIIFVENMYRYIVQNGVIMELKKKNIYF